MIQGALRDGGRRAATARSTRFSFLCTHPSTWIQRGFAKTSFQEKPSSTSAARRRILNKARRHRYDDSGQPVPKFTINDAYIRKCTAGLDPRLPSHFRTSDNHNDDRPPENSLDPDSLEIATFFLRTERAVSGTEHLDLLYRLAVEQGRWKLVVWLIKSMVETFHVGISNSDRLSQTVQEWGRFKTLEEATNASLYLKPEVDDVPQPPHVHLSTAPTLDALTDDVSENSTPVELQWHDVLGLIWRSLGRMTIACTTRRDIANGGMKPEVLEMIALLHHYGFMPASIYSQVPPENDDAIQQPPTLNLLSSRILAALSDAAWRARELTTAEEAKRRGGLYQVLHARIPGIFNRTQPPGVRPEIWLELILWSSLHGGWISQGADVLRYVTLGEDDSQWVPTSWRDSLRSVMPFGQAKLLDWDSIKQHFDSNDFTTDGAHVTGFRVDRTVSSEVVNAYIDALLNNVNPRVGAHASTLNYICKFREFLKRAHLSLCGGTWDAIVFRLLESGGMHNEHQFHTINQLAGLIPRIGEDLTSPQSRLLPSYVLDGSAAIFGLLHRGLRACIAAGDLEAACRAFTALQQRIDDDRRNSIADFFANERLHIAINNASSSNMFTENFAGIDHPSFEYRLPPETAAAFLNLAADSKAYDLATWMLNSVDLDGPMIPERVYHNPHISAALIKLATATNNKDLITKIVGVQSRAQEDGERKFPRDVLQEFFNVQVNLKRWDAATKILKYMCTTPPYYYWSDSNSANLARQMILASHGQIGTETHLDFASSSRIFQAFYNGESDIRDQLNNNATVLPVVLAVANQASQLFCERHCLLPTHCDWDLSAENFNIILETIGEVNGARAAAQLVSTFWKRHSWAPVLYRESDSALSDLEGKFPTLMRDELPSERPPRNRFRLHSTRTQVTVYGTLRPNYLTFQIVFRRALDKYASQSFEGSNAQNPPATEPSNGSEEVQTAKPKSWGGQPLTAMRTTLLYTKGTGKEVLDTFVWVLLSMRRATFGIGPPYEQLTEVLTAEDLAAVMQGIVDEETHEYEVTHGNTASDIADEEGLVDEPRKEASSLDRQVQQSDSDWQGVPEASDIVPKDNQSRAEDVPAVEKLAWYVPSAQRGRFRRRRWYKPPS